MNTEKVVVGIDLGTTTSCAFVPQQGRLKNIVREQNRNTIDSVIKITSTGTCIIKLDTAARASQLNGKDCVYEAKRVIGRKYDDNLMKEVAKNNWPFEVIKGADGYAELRVTLKDKSERELYPEDVGSYILLDLKKRAEKFLNQEIDSCVIGCPVEFTVEQRNRTLKAAVIAGFNIDNISLYPESTLAAIAYAEKYDAEATEPRKYLVYDFGGGTFDVSIVERRGTAYTTLSTDGDADCGGKDIDVQLMNYVTNLLKYRKYEINPNRLSKMKFACKQMKEAFVTESSYELVCDFVKHDEDEEYPSLTITRAAVDATAKPIINHTIDVVNRLLQSHSLCPKDINYVFMTGGSSKLNGVRVALDALFGAEKVKCDTTELCECAIAKGAALMGLKKKLKVKEVDKGGYNPVDVKPLPVIDTVPFSVMIKLADGYEELIREGEPMNHEFYTYVFPTHPNKDALIEFAVCSGDNDDMESIGYLSIPVNDKIEVAAQPLRVEARMQSSERMDVLVKNELTNTEYEATIPLYTVSDITNVIRQSTRFQEDDEKQKELKKRKDKLLMKCDEFLVEEKSEEEKERVLQYRYCIEQCNKMEELIKLEEKEKII